MSERLHDMYKDRQSLQFQALSNAAVCSHCSVKVPIKRLMNGTALEARSEASGS